MSLRLVCLPALLLISFFQAQSDLFRKHYDAANAARREGNFTRAEAEFNIILSEAYHRLGKVYLAESNYPASVGALEAAISVRRDATDALTDLAIAYFYTGKYSDAIQPLQRAIGANSQSAIAHHLLGKTYFMMGDFESARRELEATLKLTP